MLLFSHASAEVRSKKMPERKLASTRYRTHNYQVTRQTHLSLSYPGGAWRLSEKKQFTISEYSVILFIIGSVWFLVFESLPNDIIHWFKLRALNFSNDNLNVAKPSKFVFEGVTSIFCIPQVCKGLILYGY